MLYIKENVLSSGSNLKKVDNKLREAPHKFNHLPKRRPCTIEFNGLSYFVPEGSIFRDKGQLLYIYRPQDSQGHTAVLFYTPSM